MVEALRDALLERHELIGDEILEVIRSAGPALAEPTGLSVPAAVAVPAGQACPLVGGVQAQSVVNPAHDD